MRTHGRFAGVLALLGCLACAGAGDPAKIAWLTDYAKAEQDAKQRKRPLLIDFYADWCGPCRMMEENTFADAGVIRALSQLTCVRLNVDDNAELAAEFEVNGIPRLIIRDTKGANVVDLQGYTDAETLLETLRSASAQLGGIKVPAATGSAGAGGSGSIDSLIEALGNPQREVRERAGESLKKMGDKATPALLKALTHKHLSVRIGAWEALRAAIKLPAPLRFDPWAPKPLRDAVARAVGMWVTAHREKQP